mgnify:FL=1
MVTASEVQAMCNVRGVVALPFHPTHMDRVACNPVDRRVFDSLPDLDERLQFIAHHKCAWTLFYEDEPALVVGLEYKFPTCYEAWLVPGAKCYEHGTLLCRGAKRFFDKIGPKLGLLRLQIVVNVDHERAVRWADFLRFDREGVMAKYGPEGADYYMYARTY